MSIVKIRVVNGGPKKLVKGTKLTKDYLSSLERHQWFDIRLASEDTASQLEQVKEGLAQKRLEFDAAFELKKRNLTQGDELQVGVQKMVKVYVAVKRRLQPGDKMDGPYCNKAALEMLKKMEVKETGKKDNPIWKGLEKFKDLE